MSLGVSGEGKVHDVCAWGLIWMSWMIGKFGVGSGLGMSREREIGC